MTKAGPETFPVDVVITWVDGDDPAHQLKRAEFLDNGETAAPLPIAAGKDSTRFKDNGELRYCLASLDKFAPWVRNIFLITDGQTPDFLTPELARKYRVRVIDHTEILSSYEWALPTFNSRSIETAMWRIPGLAEHFIYLNDDFLLTNKTHPEDFFREDKVVLRGTWRPLREHGRTLIQLNIAANYLAKKVLGRTRTMNLLAQMRAAKLAGFKKSYFRSPHVPHPVRKSTLAGYFAHHPDVFEANIKFRFRDMSQFLAVHLADHLEISRERAILENTTSVAQISGEHQSGRSIRKTLDQLTGGQIDFLCLGSLERVMESDRKLIDCAIEKHLDL